jgi:hypothetical protein
MIEVDTGQLKHSVEAQHACTATLIQSVPVKETFGDKTVWEGIVHVFKINGQATVLCGAASAPRSPRWGGSKGGVAVDKMKSALASLSRMPSAARTVRWNQLPVRMMFVCII